MSLFIYIYHFIITVALPIITFIVIMLFKIVKELLRNNSGAKVVVPSWVRIPVLVCKTLIIFNLYCIDSTRALVYAFHAQMLLLYVDGNK